MGSPERTLLLLALAGLLGLGCNRIDLRPAPAGPNVVLVTIDTLRADHVGAYGADGAETPNLDGLAAAGVRVETAIAPTPLTLPSHASILTGRYPAGHGVRDNGGFRLGESAVTLAEQLADAGYATGAFVGAIVLARHGGLDQGFDHYDDGTSGRVAGHGGYLERSAREVTDRALAWLAGRDGAFLLWVHYYDVHADYAPPPPFDTRFAGRPYDGEIAAVDVQLGRLLEAVRGRSGVSGSLIAVTADHGESLGEHGEATHGYTLYDAALRVPLVFQGPGFPVGSVLREVASSVDVAPTLVARLGLPLRAPVDGRDLLAPHAGTAGGAVFAESLATQLHHGFSPIFAIRTPDYLYVRAPRPELYALAEDPSQRDDLLARQAREAAATGRRLDAQIEAALADEAPRNGEALAAGTRRQLEALGYAVGSSAVPAEPIDPKDGLPWLARYGAALAAYPGDLPKARAHLEAVIAALPHSARGHGLLASTLLLMGLPQEAARRAQRAHELAPHVGAFPAILGDARLQAGDPEGAASAYRRAAEIEPDEPQARSALVWVAGREGDRGAAEAHAEAALALAPESAELHVRVATFWERLGRFEEAEAVLRLGLRTPQPDASLFMLLAIQRARAGDDAATGDFLQRAGSAAALPHLRNRLGIVYAARGDRRAEAIFRALLRDHPEYPSARRNLARFLREQGRSGEAADLDGPGSL